MTTKRCSSHAVLKYGLSWVFLSIFLVNSAHAFGVGAYGGVSRSIGTLKDDFGNADHDNTFGDFGVVLDTNLARNRVFNYRLNAGLQFGNRDYEHIIKTKTVGFTMNHSFGFGILRTRSARLWLGPAIRLSVDGCTDCSGGKIAFVALGAGPEIGLNFNIGNHLTIGPSIGYQFMYGGAIIDPDGPADAQTFDGSQHHISAVFNIMFRTSSDNFE